MAVTDNGPLIVNVTWVLCLFSGSVLGLRIYAKLSRRHSLWWDDYILIFSHPQVLLLVDTVITQNLTIIAPGTSVTASISCFVSTFSKISFGVTLLRLTEGLWKWFVWFCIITLFLVMLPSAMLACISCRPVEKAWNPSVLGICWDAVMVVNYGSFNEAWCATIDFALELLPWKLLLGVGIAMSLGLLPGVCALFKGLYLVQLRQENFYYNGKDVIIWTAVETATTIVGASIPVLRVFFKDVVSSLESILQSLEKRDFPNFAKIAGRLGNGTWVEARGGEEAGSWIQLDPREDTASDKSILRGDGMQTPNPGKSGILQTSTVVTDYEERPHYVIRKAQWKRTRE
ncbi:hypothetical protein K469DRAFT_727512 [Zopfia rhizophila CBS 207.26]|uniref:Rhodopsin domain-containing protein n=1 Tax=Zopfia rhizophila CBS 207.26 TaxID=1314779 RepID=A0A6A6ESD9_9PEZI|nr:hypothetical protein K469DRAFT_727512 [Zopfia rhizophila CBS 207.26]